jgi:hypothetical protein
MRAFLLVLLIAMVGVANAGARVDDHTAGTYMDTPHADNFDGGNGVDNIQPRDDADMYRDAHGNTDEDSAVYRQDNEFDN